MSLLHFELHDFRGGIHPEEHKHQSTELPIASAGIPSVIVLPIGQHIGAPSSPIVKIGDKVLKGQIIAEPQGFVSTALHAPTSGTISAIEPRPIPHASGMNDLCIEITPDGEDTWIEHHGVKDYLDTAPAELVNIIQHSGVAGLGGAGFPSHIKLNAPAEKITTLIINAAECEPYITADDMLMREHADQVIKGIEILVHILNPDRCLIGIEDNKPEAIDALNKAMGTTRDDTHKIHVVPVPTKYPSGGEKQLIQILTGKEVPAGGIPADIGVVCQNIGTAHAIHNAVVLGQPLVSRITTVTGKACAQPRNYQTLLGTPISHLLKLAGVDHNQMNRLIMGGPMMGFTLQSEDIPIIKTTNCILAANHEELPNPELAQPCIRCGMCTEACPAQLLPQQLYWFAKSSNLEQAEAHNIADCIECGACSYVCPSNIPLVQYYRFAKGEIRQANADKIKSDRAKERFETRLARQEREAAEKEAKRKARAEAAAKKQAEKKAAAEASGAATNTDSSSTTSSTESPLPDMALLQKKLDAAKTAVEKSKEKLAAAEAEGSDKAELFKNAVEKSQQKMKDAAKAIADARKQMKASENTSSSHANEKGDPNTPERLKNKLELAESRLTTAEERLAAAQAENSDKVDAYMTAVNAQKERVQAAKDALNSVLANSNTPPINEAASVAKPSPSIEQLEQKVRAAQTRVDKAGERLEMAKAQGMDTIDALQLGLDKQKSKLADAKKQLEEAQS